MVRTLTLPGGRMMEHKPAHPERTAYRNHGGMDFDVTVREWPSVGAMQTTIRMQSNRAPRFNDWKAWPNT
jgi:hypothetical protein